jgi:hypothetical protein
MRTYLVPALLGLALGIVGCSAGHSEPFDTSRLADDIRADYDVFAVRCSKCHSLARTLNSGIDDDEYWSMYVARMRRQPASGITREDSAVVLRFLHYFSVGERRRKGRPVPAGMQAEAVPGARSR